MNWNKLKTDTDSTEDISIVIVAVFYLFKELDIEDRHIELLEMATALSGMKNALDRIKNIRYCRRKDSELEDITIVTIQKETKKKGKEYQWAVGQIQVA